jgi:hypothetical protein
MIASVTVLLLTRVKSLHCCCDLLPGDVRAHLSFCLAFHPSSSSPCPSPALCLALPAPPTFQTSLCTPFLPPFISSARICLSHTHTLFRSHSPLLPPTGPYSPAASQRTSCAIHSFHRPLFLCAKPPPGYVGLLRTLADIRVFQITTLPFAPTSVYRYASNIPFPGSRITLWQHRGIWTTLARSMRLPA